VRLGERTPVRELLDLRSSDGAIVAMLYRGDW
jgi:hypothetical protein